MRIVQASTRVLVTVVVAAASIASYGGCGAQSSERRGGGDIPDLSAGSGATAETGEAGTAGANDAGATGMGSELVPWCDAYAIINCVCQQCHQNPPLNHAPLPLVTYDDTQVQYTGSAAGLKVWQEMQTVIASRFMPFTGDATVMPPVKPLTDQQQATLLKWLAQGAVAVGGQNCPMTCDWKHAPPGSSP